MSTLNVDQRSVATVPPSGEVEVRRAYPSLLLPTLLLYAAERETKPVIAIIVREIRVGGIEIHSQCR